MTKYIQHQLLLVFLIVSVAWTSQAQERPIYTQYMFNETAFNPAYTGVPERLSMTALYRNQWVGIEGAPTTQTLSLHSPIKGEKLALGLNVLRDIIGVSGRTEIQSMYAYRIRFNETSKLSFGIQTGVRWYNEGYAQLYSETNDIQFAESYKQAKFLFGSGIYYHTERFYVGASVPVIHTNYEVKNHYFITTGYVFDLSSQLKLKPNMMVKLADNAPASFDLNANVLFHEIIWFGFSYRSKESLGVLTQLQLTEQVSFGYAFDLPIAGISHTGNGSHEITINYKIRLSPTTYTCPRYF